VRRFCLLLLAAALAGCGGDSKHAATTVKKARPGPGQILYQRGAWAVVLDGNRASAQHLVDGSWRTDASGRVHVRILGPRGRAPSIPQVAAELSSNKPLVESALWVDGEELLEKGGGTSPTRGTIYGAVSDRLPAGTHVAVAYGRTATHATAVAWTFRV